jgi:tritrans,polycis-undecaprenyl-diphosphate synthase [geranylgeranyl-diphosphate specific]
MSQESSAPNLRHVIKKFLFKHIHMNAGCNEPKRPTPLIKRSELQSERDVRVHRFEGGFGLLYDRYLSNQIKKSPFPTHVAIIMDGNRRFALSGGMACKEGHRMGKEKVREVMRWCRDIGIKYLTVYALSTENLTSRSPEELNTLFDLYEAGFRELAEDREIHRDKVRCKAVGQISLLPPRVVREIAMAEQATKDYDDLVFTVCLAYGARQELVDAIKGILTDYTNGIISLEDISVELVSEYLYTSDMPDPDLVIRTSGEERISNFLLWQMAYAELCFIDIYWPAFRKRDFLRVIRTYQGRQRRYGT